MKPLHALGAVALALQASLVMGVIVIGVRIDRTIEATTRIQEPVQYATEDRWYSDEPPAGEPVLAVWYDGYTPRAHACVFALGYAYNVGAGEQRPIESDPPVYWRRLP
jgi:hypothetical protein